MEDQEEEEEMVVLPENLFVDLINIELADWIKEETMKDFNYVKLNQDKKNGEKHLGFKGSCYIRRQHIHQRETVHT